LIAALNSRSLAPTVTRRARHLARSPPLRTPHSSRAQHHSSHNSGRCPGCACAMNYSLWLEPAAGPLRERLVREIGEQARRRGGPPFEPHVTLLADIQGGEAAVLEAAGALAKRLKVWGRGPCVP
jgi:hypothetical protein